MKKSRFSEEKIIAVLKQAEADVFDYIERFYNPRRRHSTLGYLSPVDYEKSTNSG